MNTELTEEANEFGRTAQRAFADAGGDRLVQDAEVEPAQRAERLESLLASLGAWDLEPRRNGDDCEAAAALCRSAGHWALPYPLAERLARPVDLGLDALVVIDERNPQGPVAGLPFTWTAVSMTGKRFAATAGTAPASPRSSGFVADLELTELDDRGMGDVALGLVLPCWTLLGMLDRAVEMTRAYVLDRKQFGQTLASFQGVQFQLTEAELERAGLEELAKYALWSAAIRLGEAIGDALALRLAAIEAATVVFRVSHQLHGAIGFCDEAPLSWLSRYSQPIRRLPFGLSATGDQLVGHIGSWGLSGLFDDVTSTPERAAR